MRTWRAWNMTQETLLTWPRSVSTSHALVSARQPPRGQESAGSLGFPGTTLNALGLCLQLCVPCAALWKTSMLVHAGPPLFPTSIFLIQHAAPAPKMVGQQQQALVSALRCSACNKTAPGTTCMASARQQKTAQGPIQAGGAPFMRHSLTWRSSAPDTMSGRLGWNAAQLTPRSCPSSTYFTTASPPPNRSAFIWASATVPSGCEGLVGPDAQVTREPLLFWWYAATLPSQSRAGLTYVQASCTASKKVQHSIQ